LLHLSFRTKNKVLLPCLHDVQSGIIQALKLLSLSVSSLLKQYGSPSLFFSLSSSPTLIPFLPLFYWLSLWFRWDVLRGYQPIWNGDHL